MVALDVSGSMCATDVDPNRLSAAQDAVRGFVQARTAHQDRAGAVLRVRPRSRWRRPPSASELLRALDSLTTGRGTTIGAAILKSMDAISQINPDVQAPDSGLSGTLGAPGDAPSGGGGA